MFTHTITRGYRDSSGITIQSSEVITANAERNLDTVVTHATTNVEVDWTATVAALKSISIYCDVAITIKTNSSSSPQETITILAGQNKIWNLAIDGGGTIPFAGDVTKIFVTCAGSVDGTLKIRALEAV